MAQCKLSPHEYIQNAFSPQVAILCSEDADNLCLKNNLRFVELIQPFCRLNSEIRIADPAGSTVPIRNLQVVFEDMNRRPPQPTLAKKLLSEVVGSAPWDRPVARTIGASGTREALEVELQPSTPWFELWRDTFLHVQYPSDHEFTKHYLACIVVVASTSDNPVEQLNRLTQYLHQQLHQTPARFPKWFSPNILKFCVLLHDVCASDLSRSEQIYEHMTTSFGSNNCHLLQINSRDTDQTDINLPDPWSQFLLQRAAYDVGGGSSSSEASSGTGTPREDVSVLPSRVTEGDTLDNTPETVHPLSPTPPVDDKNGGPEIMVGTEISSDVPVMLNRPSITASQHHGGRLTSSDTDRIRIFVHEFCVRSLVPHVEKQIRYLNEVVTNRSRSKSLLSATRRWLVGNKSPGNATNSVIYSSEATELQTRRLGDLCFMFGLYEVAYAFYHTAKNDFKSDQAWLYFAGAQEMAALAAFMQSSADYPKRYLDNSLQTYLNVCKAYNFAIRSTLLSTEVLKHCGEFGEAAMMFIKLTSEESDLLSALMLEQAAHCFVNSHRPLPRKYAFHMTLAGHRFSKAGQRSHSLRAYKQAFQVYATHGWTLAEDHIHFTLGKQAYHLKQLGEGVAAYTHLVDQRLKQTSPSQQSPTQQATYVREFINILHQYSQQEPNAGLPCLPLPLIDAQATRVLLGAARDPQTSTDWAPASHLSLDASPSNNARWFALERELADAFHILIKFKPNLQLLTRDTPNAESPVVPVNEAIVVEVVMVNPLSLSLVISEVTAVHQFEPAQDCSNPPVTQSVSQSSYPKLTLSPGAQEPVRLELVSARPGQIRITGVRYKLSLAADPSVTSADLVSIEGQQPIELKGPRLNTTSAERCGVVHASDRRLEITVLPEMSRLSVSLHDMPQIMSCGEVCYRQALITNTGPRAVTKLKLAVSDPNRVYLELEGKSSLPNKRVCVLTEGESADSRITNRVSVLPLPGGALRSGESVQGTLWLHAPLSPGSFEVELLFYYESEGVTGKKKYRLLRHHTSVYLERSLSLRVSSSVSQNLQKSLKDYQAEDSTRPSSFTSNLQVEVINNSEVDGVCGSYTVVGLSTNSKHWAVVPHSSLQDQSLRAGESCHLCVKCVQHLNTNSNQLVLSQLQFNDSQGPLNSWWRFSLRERISLLDLLADPPPLQPAADHIPPPPTPDQMDAKNITAANTLDMVVTAIWKSERGGHTIWGQHSVHLESLGDSVSFPVPSLVQAGEEEKPPVRIIPETPLQPIPDIIPPASKQRHLVKVSARFPDSMDHDFTTSRLCSLEFDLYLHNCSGCHLNTCLNLAPESFPSSASNQMYSPQASTQLLYVGGTLRKITLGPWSSRRVCVRACITRPGTYSLGVISLTSLRSNASRSEQPVPQTCQLQTGVTVRQTTRATQRDTNT